jgi:hypothetical protein
VTFYADGDVIGGNTLVSGSASITALPTGTHSVRRFTRQRRVRRGNLRSDQQVVDKAEATGLWASSANPSTFAGL